MVVAAFPIAKIGLLLMKQLSKPLANFIKNQAKSNPKIRKYIIAPTGKAILSLENKTIRHVTGSKVETISEDDITETGSNALGEIILFGLLTLIFFAEYSRQGDKKAIKEKTKEEEMINLQDTVLDLVSEIEKIKHNLNSLRRDKMSGSDILELEEKIHAQVHDHNFLDIIERGKNKFGYNTGSKKLDTSSPSF